MNYEIAHLGCLPSPARYLSCRSLMDSSAGREDHREQIGPDVEAATRIHHRPIRSGFPARGSSTGNETGGRKFARYHFVARQMRSPPFFSAG